jgi:trehalose 6-phosphate phosphatase
VKYALSEESRATLAAFVERRVLLAFDFDGTLAPLVASRVGARMRPRTRRLFARLCLAYPCAVISGRSRSDLSRRLGASTPANVVGNHGIEPDAGTPQLAESTRQAAVLLGAALLGRPGIEIENKWFSLSIHYRHSRDRTGSEAAILDAVSRLPFPMRAVRGKCVVNVVPFGAPHKGDALLAMSSSSGTECAVFVGDDVTDEDIFALDRPGQLMSIRVGFSRRSAAGYFLRTQLEIDDLLAFLCRLRIAGVRR